MTLRSWKIWRRQINEARNFSTVVRGMKTSFQPWMSVCRCRDSNLIGNDRLITERW
jgi:hypothetical protein